MAIYSPTDEISFFSLKKDLESYSWSTLRQDAFAGLSVALLTVPQAMAFSLLAGLPLSCGLFASIYSALIAALFGSSRHLIVGPSSAIAILIQTGLSEILYTYYRDIPAAQIEGVALQILTQITLVTALLQLLAAWWRLGRLTQFVSQSVIVGYLLGSTAAMLINQLYVFLGLSRPPGVNSLYEQATYFVTHLSHFQWTTALIGVSSFLLLLFLKRLNRKLPAGLITLAVASLIVEVLGLSSYSGSSWLMNHVIGDIEVPDVTLIGDTGEIYTIVPNIQAPFFSMHLMNDILPVAAAIALFGVMESTSVAKSIAAQSGQRLSVNQEIFGLSLGNFVSSLIGAMPLSGNPSRSVINHRSGAQTRFAAIFNAFFVFTAMILLEFIVTRIPLAALAALLLFTSLNLIHMKQLRLSMKATFGDAFVLWTTLLSCIFLSLDMAFYIGVGLSITLYLKKAAAPQLVEYAIDEAGDLRSIPHHLRHAPREIRVIKVEGELFFAAADLFQTTLKTLTEDDRSTKVIILQLKNARDIDATVCSALQQLHEYLQVSQRSLVACGLTPPIWEVLNNADLVELIGEKNLFLFEELHPHLHMQKAMQRAKEIVAESNHYLTLGITGTSPLKSGLTNPSGKSPSSAAGQI